MVALPLPSSHGAPLNPFMNLLRHNNYSLLYSLLFIYRQKGENTPGVQWKTFQLDPGTRVLLNV